METGWKRASPPQTGIRGGGLFLTGRGFTGIPEWRNWPFLAGGIRNQADFATRNSECEYAAEAELPHFP